MKYYQLILFDLDGTLFDYEKAEKFALKNAFAEFGIKQLSDELALNYKEVNHKVWQQFEKQKISAEKLRTERFKILFEYENLNLNPAKFSQRYLFHLSQANFWLKGAQKIVKHFVGKIEMVIITNGLSDVQRSRFGKSDIKNLIPRIFISEEIGIPKPHPEIFEFIFDKLSFADKQKAVIVGDSLNSDIKGANNFGIDSVWFNPNKLKNNSDAVPTFEIYELNELIKIVGM